MVLEKLLSNLAVHVEPFAVCQLCSGWRVHLPGPREVMLHYVLKGTAVVRGPDGIDREMGPNWLAVVPRGVPHVLQWAGEITDEQRVEAPPEGSPVCRIVAGPEDRPDLLVACGAVRVRYGQSMGLFDQLRDILAVDLSRVPQVRADFEGILEEQAQLGPGSGVMTSALMTQCLVHVLRVLSADEASPLPWLPAVGDENLSRAIDRILEDPGADHSVETLAMAASMSRSAFAERFSSAFGRTPMSVLHHVRMQTAARLLARESSMGIDQVAAKVGFSSRSHFSQAFKKHCGESPREYRASRG